MTDCLRDIEIIITLNSGKRVPHLEKEIFADDKLTQLYLCGLYDVHFFDNKGFNDQYMAYRYAVEIMQTQWTEAEKLIQLHDHWWHLYRHQLC